MTQAAGDRLIGRDAERATTRRAIDAALAGGAALLISGEPGIGKSALVRAAQAEAEAAGMDVLACRPAEAEAGYAYAALGDLIGRLLDERSNRLPAPQREALAVALLRQPAGLRASGASAAEPPTAGVVAAATATLLRDAAARRPLCIVVDDVQWLDPPSEQALRFAVRRIAPGAVLLAVAWRRRDERSTDADPLGVREAFGHQRLHQLELGGLSAGALHALLQRAIGLTLSRTRLLELTEMTGGNPLFALEIGRLLSRGRELGVSAQPLPLPGSLAQLMSARIAAAPPAAKTVLEIAALADRPTMATLEALLDSTERAEAVLDAAAAAGLVEMEADRIRPAHPLLASAARAAMAPARRRDLHRRLASAASDDEARARHLALSTSGVSRDVAAALESAAQTARVRGAVDSVAQLLGMAVDRTPANDQSALRRRQLLFGEALLDAGDLPAAGAIADQLLASAIEPVARGRVALVRATVAWYLETSEAAVAPLVAALARGIDDPAVAGRIHMHLAVFYDFDLDVARHHAAEAVRHLELALTDDPGLAGTLATALCQLFYSEVLLGMPPREDLLRQALAIEPPSGRVDRSTVPGLWWLAVGRLAEARQRFERLLGLSRETGDLSGEADLLTRLAEVALAEERLAEAARLADEAIAAAQQAGQTQPEPALRALALADAFAGDVDSADRAVQQALARLNPAGGEAVLVAAWVVVGVLVAATRGDAARVEQLGGQSAAHLAAAGIREPLRLDVSGERAAALCQLGRLSEAEELLDELAARNARIPRGALAAALARGRALLASARGDAKAATATLDVASDTGDWPRFERARCLLLRGQLERRARDRRAARQSLEHALAAFEAVGAKAWAEQARAELGRLGRHRPGTEDLTPAEREVALLAGAALATREIAARLFVSPKTVEAHLTHIYGKLGVSSRAELAARLARSEPL